MLNLIKKIEELKKTKGEPNNSLKIKKVRKELTELLLKEKKETYEIEDYILQIGYTNGDLLKPYTQIFTKESFKNYKDYKINLSAR
jgi:hypothetical protein